LGVDEKRKTQNVKLQTGKNIKLHSINS